MRGTCSYPSLYILLVLRNGVVYNRFVWACLGIGLQGKDDEVVDVPFVGNGYNYQAEAVGRCLAAEQLECPVMPLEESLSIMRTMDDIRALWGLRYPAD